MKKTLILAILIGAMITAYVSCQKNRSESTDVPVNFTVEEAISYHHKLESRYGNYDLITVSGNTEKSIKQVDFSKAYIFCEGYSFIVIENTSTGAEYSFPIDHQNFFMGEECTTMWETHVPLPPNIPDGQYYVKVILSYYLPRKRCFSTVFRTIL